MPEKVKVRRAIPEKDNDFDDDNSEEETKKVRKRKKKIPGQKRVTGNTLEIDILFWNNLSLVYWKYFFHPIYISFFMIFNFQ